MKPIAVILLVLTAALAAGSAAIFGCEICRAGYDKAHRVITRQFPASRERRERIIATQAAQMKPGGAVILGDSIVELQTFDSLCGLPVLNAGLSGSTTGGLAARSAAIISAARPSLVVFAVGVNDGHGGKMSQGDEWLTQYRMLLRSAGTAKIIIVGIQPIEPGMRNSGAYDMAGIAARNRAIERLAAEAGAIHVRPMPDAAGMTTDGVHLNAAGMRRWQAKLASACPAVASASFTPWRAPADIARSRSSRTSRRGG